MVDIAFLQAFAQGNSFDLTGPLSNAQVTRLSRHWLPEINFHWMEKYHPISLDEALSMVEDLFASFPEQAKDTWRVPKWVRQNSTAVLRLFDPPLVTVPSGFATPAGPDQQPVATVRVLTEQNLPAAALEDPDVDSDARTTHGASDGRSEQFFGSTTTTTGAVNPAPGDPLIPRAGAEDEQGQLIPHITVMATYKNLLETLEYNLPASGLVMVATISSRKRSSERASVRQRLP